MAQISIDSVTRDKLNDLKKRLKKQHPDISNAIDLNYTVLFLLNKLKKIEEIRGSK